MVPCLNQCHPPSIFNIQKLRGWHKEYQSDLFLSLLLQKDGQGREEQLNRIYTNYGFPIAAMVWSSSFCLRPVMNTKVPSSVMTATLFSSFFITQNYHQENSPAWL